MVHKLPRVEKSKTIEFVRPYYDDETDMFGVQFYRKTRDGSFEVNDWATTIDMKEAKKLAKEYSKKRGWILERGNW
jgi:hypothetical protein